MQRIEEGPLAANPSRYIQGIQFPALKHDVVHAFRKNGAPDEVVQRLQDIPVTEFASEEQLNEVYRNAREDDLNSQQP